MRRCAHQRIKNPKSQIPNPKSETAFSLVELLITAALGAAIITVAVIAFQTLTSSGTTRTAYGTVTVGSALVTFYGGSATSLDYVFFAPSYGRAAQAEVVRSQFNTDLQAASAVYCLGRNGVDNVHATRTIPVASTFRGDSLDLPERFRQLLASAVPASASTFTDYRGASTATNASIFLLQPSASTTTLRVLAIYDIDLTATTSPAGTYASVKRYGVTSTTAPDNDPLALTDYYDVFYPAPASGGPTIAFNPLVVCFERAARASKVEGAPIDRLKVAAERPFYFVWWPDPAAPALQIFSAPTYDATDPKAAYAAMGARTSFFFAVPMFPAL